MDDTFKKEVSLISHVCVKLTDSSKPIEAVHDEVAFNLYKKCSSAFDLYESSTDKDSFKQLRDNADNIVGFREYIQEYYPDKVYSNTNVKENNKVKELSNGKSLLEKENVA